MKIIQVTRILFMYHSSSIRLITDLGLSLGWLLAISVGRHLVKMVFYADLVNKTKMLINDWSLFADNHMMSQKIAIPLTQETTTVCWLLTSNPSSRRKPNNPAVNRLLPQKPCSGKTPYWCLLRKFVICWYPHTNKDFAEFNTHIVQKVELLQNWYGKL